MTTAVNAKFPTGATVTLKSGGPQMTVQHREGYGAGVAMHIWKDEIPCVWFDEVGQCHERSFAAEVLR